MSVGVLVLAGGSGSRFGADRNKVYLPLAGRSVLSWSVNTLLRVPEVTAMVLVTRPADGEFVERMLATEVLPGPDAPCGLEVVPGGATRQESELCGLRRLAERIGAGTISTVLVHDGARPLVTAGLAEAVISAARRYGGAVPGLARIGLAVTTAGGDQLTGLLDPAPDELIAVQTPQGFAAVPLLDAYQRAQGEGYVGTDTSSCVRHYTSVPVHWVPGEESNIKVTYPHDLVLAEALLVG